MSRSRGRADHRSLITHVPLIGSYNGRDSIAGGASDASDQDPTAAIKCVI